MNFKYVLAFLPRILYNITVDNTFVVYKCPLIVCSLSRNILRINQIHLVNPKKNSFFKNMHIKFLSSM